MDSLVFSALDEICSQGQTGLPISSLWPKLENSLSLSLSPSLRASLHSNLLKIPSLQFRSPQNAALDAADASIQRVENAERLGLRFFASSKLADSFAGLYDSTVSAPERRVLERLALVRENGITQTQLEKEFGIKAENFFYKVKNPECKGLIVRQPVVVRTKETSSVEGKSKSSPCRSTKMMYLRRYAKHLSAQQKLEISKEGPTVDSFGKEYESENATSRDSFPRESFTQDVHVKDYLPAMEAICKKLEEANGKVQPCMHLLKKISLKEFERNSLGCGDNTEKEQQMKFGRRSPKNEQLVELPIEHQIYDMVDAEGSKGLAVIEAENHKTTVAFRVWTSGNSNSKSSNPFISKSKIVDGDNEISYLDSGNPDDVPRKPAQTFFQYGHSTSESDFATPGEKNDAEINIEIPHGFVGNGRTNHMLPSPGNLQESIQEPSGTDLKDGQADISYIPILNSTSNSSTKHGELEGISVPVQGELESTATETNTSRSEKGHPALSKPHTNPHPLLTADGLRRKQRILERLQDDKFILRAELQKWLDSLEDKGTTMDRKTILRILTNLRWQGHCKFLNINVPVLSNCGRSRSHEVVLHPSIQNLTDDLLSEIHDRVRSFEMQIRGQGSSRWKKNHPVPVLDGVQRTQSRIAVKSDDKAIKLETISANGFVMAKMVRAKLLHKFLWSYLSSSSGSDDALSSREHVPDFLSTHSSCKLFSLETIIKNIPLGLFSQVAGSNHKIDNTIEKCKKGLCLSDLPVQEYKRLMDTRATGRLSKIIDILRRLKLIRLVANGHSDDGINIPHANLTHAMELKPYIEEPVSVFATSNFTSLDLHPPIRHDYILSSEESVDEYWQTVEYFYAVADRRAALHAFLGSAVQEVFISRSWASVQVMTADQRAKLLSRIAKDLNLTLEQEDDHLETVEEIGPNVGQRTFSNVKQPSQKSFLWTDEADRQLVIEYVKRRVAIGPKYNRVKWTLLSNLPAPPKACKRRMSSLIENKKVREVLMKLCNMLSERYVKHLEKTQSNDDCRSLENAFPGKVITRAMPPHTEDAGFEKNHWDDFDDINIKRVLEGVLKLKQMAKLEASTRVGSVSWERSNSISKYRFPIDTGRRAANFSRQLHERKNDLIEQGINLDADLQCGDILHLFYLVSSGELSISPCLPDEGVGETEDFRSLKRKNEDNDLCDSDKAKKLKFFSEGELNFRREKGFPGIKVSAHRATIMTVDAVEMFKDGETCTAEHQGNAELNSTLGEGNDGSSCQSDCMNGVLDVESVVTIAGSSSESPWDAMTTYAEYLLSPDQKEVSFFSPQVFKTVFAAIQKAGDQGLSMEEVSHVLDMPGEKIPECIIDVLQAFGRALKVNAYDSVRVVDALYRSKFFLTSMDGFRQDRNKSLLDKKRKADNVHQVHDDSTKGAVAWPGGNNNEESYKFSSSGLYMPILPWINGDGTTNNVVYNGHLRRLLGVVMQNPGILEDEIIHHMDVLTPQARLRKPYVKLQKLMELMVLDGHLITRRMRQTTYSAPPAVLQTLIGSRISRGFTVDCSAATSTAPSDQVFSVVVTCKSLTETKTICFISLILFLHISRQFSIKMNNDASSSGSILRWNIIRMGFEPSMVDQVIQGKGEEDVDLVLETLFNYSGIQSSDAQSLDSVERLFGDQDDTSALIIDIPSDSEESSFGLLYARFDAPINELVDFISAAKSDKETVEPKKEKKRKIIDSGFFGLFFPCFGLVSLALFLAVVALLHWCLLLVALSVSLALLVAAS
ncbi:hypothetical protein EZV62_028079 [Acer yangbiense]|uniref:Uncharacterized protein n=1 Tax=Acer yangbiense TaxID=1000413 RepID=A0A5C7GQ27_9ROSI|nr:hypothetical protein EZV62_028079 [Acer yangbiense]